MKFIILFVNFSFGQIDSALQNLQSQSKIQWIDNPQPALRVFVISKLNKMDL